MQHGDDEAFFPDEWGSTVLSTALHQNKYATVGKTAELQRRNPLTDPSIASTSELTAAELQKIDQYVSGTYLNSYKIFVPPGFGGGSAKISLLFAVGTEMMRHGLRKFFDGFSDRILVVISGIIEGAWKMVQDTVKHAWGVGITTNIINDLLAAAGVSGVSWEVDVVACYSTGYRGLNGTINNFATQPGKLDLTHVSMVVVYDALYRGDAPLPGNNTQRALGALESVTSSRVSVAVYEVTMAGTPRENSDTVVSQSWLQKTFGSRYALINLKKHGIALSGLIYARMFDAAVKDGYLAANTLPSQLQNLMSALPPRSQVCSPMPASFRRLPGGADFMKLTDWEAAHDADLKALVGQQEVLRQGVISNGRFLLMGWGPPAVGEIYHDGFIPEFGWELLAG